MHLHLFSYRRERKTFLCPLSLAACCLSRSYLILYLFVLPICLFANNVVSILAVCPACLARECFWPRRLAPLSNPEIHGNHVPGPRPTMNNPHDYLISSAPSRPIDPDNADSWVMLNQGGFVKLGNERILYKLDSRISCELSVPPELRDRCVPFQRKSDRGALFLTNKRVGSAFLKLPHDV